MELLKTKELKISTNIFRKICRELKMEIKDNRNQLEKLNKLDYEYNKKIIDLEELTKRIDFFLDKDVVERKTLNNVVSLYGDPYCVIDIMLSAVMNCQIVNILIEDMCVGVNKLIVTLYQEILKDYKIHDIISLNNNVGKKELEEKKLRKAEYEAGMATGIIQTARRCHLSEEEILAQLCEALAISEREAADYLKTVS